jgi:hypothetical protein
MRLASGRALLDEKEVQRRQDRPDVEPAVFVEPTAFMVD